jgi:ATP-dependent exoDNAse (exonuclease V) alpha subunit
MAAAAMPATLEGVLDRVTFSNDENAWSVVKLEVPGTSALVTAVGNLLGVQPGESLRLSGRWTTDRKYGEQSRVDSYVTVKPATLVGIEKYLGSGLVRGVGKVMAERLVQHFGLATLEVIDREQAKGAPAARTNKMTPFRNPPLRRSSSEVGVAGRGLTRPKPGAARRRLDRRAPGDGMWL